VSDGGAGETAGDRPPRARSLFFVAHNRYAAPIPLNDEVPMKRTSIICAAAAVAVQCLLPDAAAAQAVDSAAFIVRLGHDTVAVERWVRTADRIDVVAVGRSPRTVTRRYSLRFDPSGRVTHATIGDAAERDVAGGAIPIAGGFQAPYIVALERAARGGAAETTVSMQVGNATRDFTVRGRPMASTPCPASSTH
jgi:hypothetical protein